jgi:hypothetical protein
MRDNNPSSFGWGDNPLISITAKIDIYRADSRFAVTSGYVNFTHLSSPSIRATGIAGCPIINKGIKSAGLRDFSATQTVCLTVGRDSPRASEIGETPILKGAIALACQWAIRRCDLYFPNPTRFDPDRTFHGRQLVRRIDVLTSGFEISGDVQKYKARTYTANEIEPRIGALGLIAA